MVLPKEFPPEAALNGKALPVRQGRPGDANSTVSAEGGPGTGNELKRLCREFESIFVYQLLQTMRSSIPKEGLFSGGRVEELYQPMLDEELARKVALERGLGLGEILYRQFSRLAGKSSARTEKAPRADAKKEGGKDMQLFATPSEGFLSSDFGLRSDPISGVERGHNGLDIAAGMGSPILASRAGRVIFSGERGGYGKLVILDHGDGYTTYYAHNSELLVEEGQRVEASETVALSGRSGRVTGPHVHFEVRHRGKPVDPRPLIDQRI